MGERVTPLSEALSDYLHQAGWREHLVMQALRVQAQQYHYGKMQTVTEQALLLQFLARLTGVKRYLEIGVFTGYSTLAVALALPEDGRIIGCDIRPDFAQIAHQYWEQAGVAHKVELWLQPAEETLAALSSGDPFDLIYIDADKANYPLYYESALALLIEGGVMAIDNVLLGGRVMYPVADEHPSVGVMRALNKRVQQDPRVEMVMVPIGDGLTLVQKRKQDTTYR